MGSNLIDNQQKSRVLELALKALDDDILPAESRELENHISSSKPLAAYYSVCIKMHLCMVELEASRNNLEGASDFSVGPDFWQTMAVYEKMAPETETVEKKAQRELIQKIHSKKTEYKISRSSLYSIVASVAAILLIGLFVRFTPPRSGEVAVLEDSLNAQWANTDLSMGINSGFSNADGVRHLLKGCIKVRFSEGAEVIIEGPAEFEFKSSNSMGLNSGRLYANVGGYVSGFTVDTPTSKIVDLGTQFGVKVDFDGTCDLYMFKGRAVISTNVPNGTTLTREVVKGQALRVKSSSKSVEKVQFEDKIFVREMSSANQLVWRGESIDLANLTGGNLGLSKGDGIAGIDPLTGDGTNRVDDNGKAENTYVPVAWNPFVDGVFVPNGIRSQIVSSKNHRFSKCPVTNGYCRSDVGVLARDDSIVLDGIAYGNAAHPCLFMRSNLGITYDLDYIRSTMILNDAALVFRSKIGINEAQPFGEGEVDFWVLVDGKVCYQKRSVRNENLFDEIELKLVEDVHFLTLVVTDSGTGQVNAGWCVFAEPRIDIDTARSEFVMGPRVLIDFGPSNVDDGRPTDCPDINGNYWNNWHPELGSEPIANNEIFGGTIVDTDNNPTSIDLVLTGGFGGNGRIKGGLLVPDELLLGDFAIATATEDYWFSKLANGAGIKITGLNPDLTYDLRMFSTRESTDERITRYAITDVNGKQYVDLRISGAGIGSGGYSGNNDTIVGFSDLVPNANGELFLDVSVLEGEYAYLGILEIAVKSRLPKNSN